MMKKVVSLLLALVMTLGLCVNVWAEGEDNGPPAGGEMTGTTGTVKNVDSLACVDGTAESDLAAAKAFLGENGWFVYYEEGNQIMPRGITSFQDADFKTKMSKAAGAYTNLSDGAKAILDTLYVSDGQHLCKFSERVDGLKAYADSIGAGGTDPGPGPGPGPGGGEQGGQVDIDEALKGAGYTAPVLQTEGNSGDFYITFPDELKRGTDYEYNYANGVLTVTVLKGSEEHWLAAAKASDVNVRIVLKNTENANRIADYNGNDEKSALSFINEPQAQKFNNTDGERGYSRPMAAVNQQDGVLSVTASNKYSGIRTFVMWGKAAGEGDQVTVVKKSAIVVYIIVEGENNFHYSASLEDPQGTESVNNKQIKSVSFMKPSDWMYWMEPGTVFVTPKGGKTVTETLVQQATPPAALGQAVITAPAEGYSLALNECTASGDSRTLSENKNSSDLSRCLVDIYAPNGKPVSLKCMLVWASKTGEKISQQLNIMVRNGSKLDTLEKPVSVPNDVPNAGSGINVIYDNGYFYTMFDGRTLPTYKQLQQGVTLSPSADIAGKVTHFRVAPLSNGSAILDADTLGRMTSGFTVAYVPEKYDENTAVIVRFAEVDFKAVGDIQVGYTFDLGYRHRLVQWLQENDNGTYEVLGYTYVCGRNDSFVQTTITDAERSEKNAEKPYIIGKDGEKFKCDRYPQRGEGKDKQYFQFTLIGGQGRENGKYVVYVPYAYFGMTTADGAARKARGEYPTIKHYYNNNHELREEFKGEYTEYGIKFEVSSFSPFVISTAAQSSSGGGYYYGGASTPGISAVKTADAAKSATDYTSGIYGLTFRSTAAFSGFKGVQVDGRTIAAANYVAEDNGGIEVYLKAVYLRTLKDGRHTVTILSDAGNVTMNFTIGGVDSPTTFDAGIGAYVSMALASVGSMAWMRRRKR